MHIDVVVQAKFLLGESPLFDERSKAIVWTDIEGKHWHRYLLNSGSFHSYSTGGIVSALVKREKGGIFAAVEEGFGLIREGAGYDIVVRNLHSYERMNDAKCDSKGRLWAGSTDRSFRKGVGRLHRLDANLSHKVMIEDMTLPNGIDWSPDDSKIYLVDSLEHVLLVFDFDSEYGELSNRRVLYEFSNESGIPDGISVSAQGDIFVAMWDGAQIMVISDLGEKLDCLKVPVRRPTSCVFGGENYDELFVTSASIGLPTNHDSRDGSLLKVSGLGVTGKASNSFSG
jgi:sugar lactone lactonase YvrE